MTKKTGQLESEINELKESGKLDKAIEDTNAIISKTICASKQTSNHAGKTAVRILKNLRGKDYACFEGDNSYLYYDISKIELTDNGLILKDTPKEWVEAILSKS